MVKAVASGDSGSALAGATRNQSLAGSNPPEQYQYQYDDDDKPEATTAVISCSVKRPAANAAEAAKKCDNQNDQNDRSDSHLVFLQPVFSF